MKEIQLTDNIENALYDDILGYYKVVKDGADDIVIIKNYKYRKLQLNHSITLNNCEKLCVVEVENGENYIVRPLDTLASIAEKYNISKNQIIAKNNLHNDRVFVGQVLKL